MHKLPVGNETVQADARIGRRAGPGIRFFYLLPLPLPEEPGDKTEIPVMKMQPPGFIGE
ncbi:MAG: hypothetical protein ACYDBT_07925 [Desulfobulbaceae bacterium]